MNRFLKLSKSALFQSIMTLAILLAATLLSTLLKTIGFSETNIVVIYILSVLIIAYKTTGYMYGISASIIGLLSFNFFFTEPLHTFNVNNKSYILTFIVMLTASILTSTLTSKMMQSSSVAAYREKQSNILYQITSSLAKATSISDVAIVSVRCLSNLFDCDVFCITTGEEDGKIREYCFRKENRGPVVQVIEEQQIDGIIRNSFVLTIADTNCRYGMICFPSDVLTEEEDQRKLLSSINTQILVAMERERLAYERQEAKDEIKREKYKSSLLRAISHDIRTPLSGITGSAEILLYNLGDEESKELIKNIYEDSVWLTQMVENILNLTKVQERTLLVHKQKEAAEEIIGAAIKHASIITSDLRIVTELPPDILLIPMDGNLIVQVLINLINNAVVHSESSNIIKIAVEAGNDYAWFSVQDNGTGFNEKDLPQIFELFYIGVSELDAKRGIGLGLAICKAIINAHGGIILAENNPEGGATIRFSLPMDGTVNNGG